MLCLDEKWIVLRCSMILQMRWLLDSNLIMKSLKSFSCHYKNGHELL